MRLSPIAIDLINRYQGGFPLDSERPFQLMADRLGTSEEALLQLIRQLEEQGLLSRFGPIYNASLLGGDQTLAAMAVPEQRFDQVAGVVNAMPEVAHNYRRGHRLNMWFVLATAAPGEIDQVLRRITQATGLPVYNFPKLHEFYLGLWLLVDDQGAVDTVPLPERGITEALPFQPDALDHRIIGATQAGLPLAADPLAVVAEQTGLARREVLERMLRMEQSGAIRRIGAIPNHYRLGLRGNGMTVWDIPDDLAVELGSRVGAMDFVSHAYLRPRHAGVWRYNLFAMVHGREREEVRRKADRIERLLRPHCRAHDVLFSSKVLKKTGLRLAA